MKPEPLVRLSRRERQIMEILYRTGRATVGEILERLEDPPTYSAVRGVLGVLGRKGQVRHLPEGTRYVYVPTVPRKTASRSVLQNMVHTFFDGSTEKAVAALLDISRSELTEEDLSRLSDLIEQARKEGR